MLERIAQRTGAAETSPTLSLPPAIRLVHSFKEAMVSSQPADNSADESFVVESLLIAANASFEALARFADLWHTGTYGESPSVEAGEEQTVIEGYETWLEAADTLHDRVRRLTETAYESEGIKKFEGHCRDARNSLDEARDRRSVERKALSTDQLVALAAKLKPTWDSYD